MVEHLPTMLMALSLSLKTENKNLAGFSSEHL